MKKFVLIVFFILLFSFFKNISGRENYRFSNLETDLIYTRQEYLGDGLGKIYKNRFGVKFFNDLYPSLIKIESRFFSDLRKWPVYVFIYGVLLWAGIKKFNEK